HRRCHTNQQDDARLLQYAMFLHSPPPFRPQAGAKVNIRKVSGSATIGVGAQLARNRRGNMRSRFAWRKWNSWCASSSNLLIDLPQAGVHLKRTRIALRGDERNFRWQFTSGGHGMSVMQVTPNNLINRGIESGERNR